MSGIKLFRINKLNVFLAVSLAIVMVWSYCDPFDRLTWWLEATPVLIGLFVLFVTRENIDITPLIITFLWLHALILLVGAHYTYAEVPFFDFGTRNNYDKVGHFMQGFVPALVARELLLKTSPLKRGKWLVVIICLACLGISALYEIIEWLAAAISGEAAESFLGTQGDVWDTQKDMMWALIGAAVALAFFSCWHDRQLKGQLDKKA